MIHSAARLTCVKGGGGCRCVWVGWGVGGEKVVFLSTHVRCCACECVGAHAVVPSRVCSPSGSRVGNRVDMRAGNQEMAQRCV